jgi:hypothetical protein
MANVSGGWFGCTQCADLNGVTYLAGSEITVGGVCTWDIAVANPCSNIVGSDTWYLLVNIGPDTIAGGGYMVLIQVKADCGGRCNGFEFYKHFADKVDCLTLSDTIPFHDYLFSGGGNCDASAASISITHH